MLLSGIASKSTLQMQKENNATRQAYSFRKAKYVVYGNFE
jgi:hypothetical protein